MLIIFVLIIDLILVLNFKSILKYKLRIESKNIDQKFKKFNYFKNTQFFIES